MGKGGSNQIMSNYDELRMENIDPNNVVLVKAMGRTCLDVP